MSNSKKWIIVLLSVLITVLCGLALVACNNHPEWHKPKGGIKDDGSRDPNNPNGDYLFYYPEGTDPNQFIDEDNAYVLQTVSKGGIGLNNVKVSVLKDGMVITEARSVNGSLRLAIPAGDYDLVFDDLPAGYFTDSETITKLTKDNRKPVAKFNSAVIDSTVPANHTYRAGEVMYDFEITDADGLTVKLSELLKNYKFVLLNMFYTTCGPCKAEFPAMERTYQAFKDKAYIVSIDNQDGANSVKKFKNDGYSEVFPSGEVLSYPYTFFMATDTKGLTDRFGTGVYPTNVFIDRYGVIAYIETGTITADEAWVNLFNTFTSDNYSQNSTLIDDSNNGGSSEATPPNDYIKAMAASEQALSEAVVDASMLPGGKNEYPAGLPLHFYGPDPNDPDEANDAAHTWPFTVGQESDGSSYIAPTNVGTYTYTEDGEEKVLATDNTYSILYTDITLQANDVLTVDVRLNIEQSGDLFYLVINNTLNSDLIFSTSTGDKWQTVTLYTATYTTVVNLNMMFVKDTLGTAENEFVGIRNLKVATIDTNTNTPLDVKTEMARLGADDSVTYTPYYKNETDGFYHVKTENPEGSPDDPIIYVNVEETNFWVDRHLKNYDFVNSEGARPKKAVYYMCYWLFNSLAGSEDGGVAFQFDPNEAIIDAHFIQQDSGYLVPLSEDLKSALEGFVAAVKNENSITYENGGDQDWLEMCVYYMTFGNVDHKTAEDHFCLSTNNPANGLTVSFAIPIESKTETKVVVDSELSTPRNMAGGLFYEFKAPQEGAYTFSSSNVVPANTDASKIYVWKTATAPYKGDKYNLLAEEENFNNVYVYLTNGQVIWLQLTQSNPAGNRIKYEVDVKREGDEAWALANPNPDNVWTFLEGADGTIGQNYYPTVNIAEDVDGKYYHKTTNGDNASPVYIDFLGKNYYSDDHDITLEDMIKHGVFANINQGYDVKMRGYLAQSKEGKQEDDWDYGLLHADTEIVNVLVAFTQSRDPVADKTSGFWKAFGKYVRYYGPTEWKDFGDGTTIVK